MRAGIADNLRDSAQTSIQQRLAADETAHSAPLCAVTGPAVAGLLPMRQADYLRLVDWAGRQLHPGKRGRITDDTPPALGIGQDPARWLSQVSGIESRYCRAIGSAHALLDKAREIGQHWLMVRLHDIRLGVTRPSSK